MYLDNLSQILFLDLMENVDLEHRLLSQAQKRAVKNITSLFSENNMLCCITPILARDTTMNLFV